MSFRFALILALLTPAATHAQPDAAPPQPTWRQAVGFDAAFARLRPDVPLGRDIVVGYVEGDDGAYAPDPSDRRMAGIDLLLRSGESQPSDHATLGASIGFGPGGVAPGVRALHAFSVRHWLGEGYLNVTSADPPVDDGLRLFNHSWIGGPSPGAAHILRRIDWVIDERDVVMCAGVNNGRDSTVPGLLASSYNLIAVGTARGGGNSSGGYTIMEVSGRCKPDIVGPRGLTSFATVSVTASCAILMERARGLDDARARRSELIKAVLLAGASKPGHWSTEPGKPLDEHLGAGVVNVDRSLQVLDAGPVDGVRARRPFGWSFVQLERGQSRQLFFETSQPWRAATFVAVWHRRIDGRTADPFGTGRTVWLDAPRLADVDLVLWQYDDEGRATELAASRSPVDNVEHVYRRALAPGRYRLQVQRGEDRFEEAWDVAIAWWMQPAPHAAEAADPADISPEQVMPPTE